MNVSISPEVISGKVVRFLKRGTIVQLRSVGVRFKITLNDPSVRFPIIVCIVLISECCITRIYENLVFLIPLLRPARSEITICYRFRKNRRTNEKRSQNSLLSEIGIFGKKSSEYAIIDHLKCCHGFLSLQKSILNPL